MNLGAPGAGLAPGCFDFSLIPFQPPELPFNTLVRPFPGYRFGYLHPHGNIPYATPTRPRHSRGPPAVRSHRLPAVAGSPHFHINDWPDCLQIGHAKDSNGHLYLLYCQSLVDPSSPSWPNGTPYIPFIFMLFQSLSVTTNGYTPSLNFIFRSVARSALCEPTNCALLRNNSFTCHTLAPREFEGCAFHGGRGV